MTRIKLKYVHEFRDRHGKPRHYFRRNGKRVPLPGAPGSSEFMAAYAAALAGTPPPPAGATRTIEGSVGAMVVGYLMSAAFRNLAPASQQQYCRIFEGLRREHGHRGIAGMERRHVVLMLDAKAAAPGAARDFLRCLRLVVRYAIDIGVCSNDPTAGVRVKMPKSDGFRAWSEADIDIFKAAYEVGSKQRLALEMLLNTALRCADVVRVGRGHVRAGEVHITAQKNGAVLQIPINTEMAQAINAAASSDHVTFLLNEQGRSFTAKGFGKWFVKQCVRIGLKGLSPHGLRKASLTRLADAGCTIHEIMAISGHKTLKQVEPYTRKADQARLARNAMKRARTTQ